MPVALYLCVSALTAALGQRKAVLTESNIVYARPENSPVTMDYYAAMGNGLHPAVIIIHGGGFVGGDSHGDSELYCADFLTPSGFAVFSINYRLAPQHPYPAAIEDVQAAIRFIRLHAGEYRVDPSRVALVGGSAGGYLSNMAGVLNEGAKSQDRTLLDGQSAQVNAVVTLYGITDFEALPVSEHERQLLAPLIRYKGLVAAQREASPINHIRADDPPFLQIMGDKDEYFPLSQMEHFDAALRKAGVVSETLTIPGGTHGTNDWHRVPQSPPWETDMVLWLDKVLRYKSEIGEGIRQRGIQ